MLALTHSSFGGGRKKIDDNLLDIYDSLQNAYANGLAVVTIERNTCGGCFSEVPPQVQLDLDQRKRIIRCEHCARILVAHNIDKSLAQLEEEQAENVE